MVTPEIFVLSGPNGAGKSTTARVLLPETLSIEQFVNADLIAQGLSLFAPKAAPKCSSSLVLDRQCVIQGLFRFLVVGVQYESLPELCDGFVEALGTQQRSSDGHVDTGVGRTHP